MTHRIRKAFFLAAILLAISIGALITMPAAQAAPPTGPLAAPGDCTVMTTADSITGSLRACIQGLQPGATITFALTTFPPLTAGVILPLTPLPNITTDNVTIDGSSAGVILSGSSLSFGNGLTIDGASAVTIKGLQILNFPYNGIHLLNGATNNTIGGVNATPGGPCSGDCNVISGNGRLGVNISNLGTMSNTVSGNYVGVDMSGTTPLGNGSSRFTEGGIKIEDRASYNLIGGSTPGERNLISGNSFNGLMIGDGSSPSLYNVVSGNFIGVDPTGLNRLSNGRDGIVLLDGAEFSRIGGTTPGERNLISGNDRSGIHLYTNQSLSNTIVGNYIGTNISGTAVISNDDHGIEISDETRLNVITGNLISGNSGNGVWIGNGQPLSNTLKGNYIGTDASGTAPLGNGENGILIEEGAAANIVGGTKPGGGCTGDCNLISGNRLDGIAIHGVGGDAPLLDDVSLTINGGSDLISNGDFSGGLAHWGTYDYDGSPMASRVLNTSSYHSAPASYQFNRSSSFGELLTVYDTTPQSVVYTTEPWDNPNSSVWINVSPGDQLELTFWYSGTLTSAEFIGLDTSNDADEFADPDLAPTTSWTQLVLTATVPANVVKVSIVFVVKDAPPVVDNVVTGNTIGLDASGTTALPNQRHGVRIDNWAINNRIGGPNSGDGNLISSNAGDGVHIEDPGTLYNTIQQNSIYNNVGLGISLENGGNAELAPPSIITPNLTANTVSGTACANCTVEIFSDDEDEGQVYEGNTTADGSGNWTLNKGSAFTGPNLTATATDSQGNTSEFGRSSYDIYLPLIIKSGS